MSVQCALRRRFLQLRGRIFHTKIPERILMPPLMENIGLADKNNVTLIQLLIVGAFINQLQVNHGLIIA